MGKVGAKNTGWSDSDLMKAHRARCIGILLNDDQDLWHSIFHPGCPIRPREEREIFEDPYKSLNLEEAVLIRAALDFWNSSGDLPLWQCLWDMDYLSLVRLIRAVCHLREIQLEAIQGIMTDYLGYPHEV